MMPEQRDFPAAEVANDCFQLPKGWTGPKVVDGIPIEGTFRSHQVPLSELSHKTRSHSSLSRVDAEL